MDRGESFSKVGAVVPLVDNTPGTHTRLPVATPFELKGLRPHGDFGTKSGIQEESKNDAVNSVNLSRRGRTHMSTQNGRRQRADSLLDSLVRVSHVRALWYLISSSSLDIGPTRVLCRTASKVGSHGAPEVLVRSRIFIPLLRPYITVFQSAILRHSCWSISMI